jgi:hypothetical protein
VLFYNYILRRFVVIDLKVEDFKPEFAGKMVSQAGSAPARCAHSVALTICPPYKS